jgi:hypothetical protein
MWSGSHALPPGSCDRFGDEGRHPLGILEIARSDAKEREEDAALRLVLNEPHEIVVARNAHVQIAVGGHDDAVRATFNEVLPGLFVGRSRSRAA